MSGLLIRSLSIGLVAMAGVAQIVPNRAPLQPTAYTPLPLGAVTPEGWLRRQLEIQAAGLTGHLDEFWADVGSNSGWLGGKGESWERGPYFLDGLLPLAYQLNDPKLIAKVRPWMEWVLTHQQASGQIGPASNDDWWPRMVMLKVLAQYQEVTGDARVVPLMSKYFAFERKELPGKPLRDWGRYRWQDNVYTVLWLYNRTGDAKLLELAKLLHQQGFDWNAEFSAFEYKSKQHASELGFVPNSPPPDRAMQTHGVNIGMSLKAGPVWWQVTGDPDDRQTLSRQLAMLDKYHGLPNGIFSADEHLAGPDPSQGTELCTVVESMFSYEEAFATLGDAALADRLERVTYNALPATLSNDMWSHQYDQQPNQIACTRAHRDWSTNGNDSNLFGLEPNFGCCTANLHQGWPKFVSSMWVATSDGGLLAEAYGPSRVSVALGGTKVSIDEETNYPFDGKVLLRIHAQKATAFPLLVRRPGWSESFEVRVNGKRSDDTVKNGFVSLRRSWREGDRVEISIPMKPRVSHWYKNSVVYERGPLVFALPLTEKWTKLRQYNPRSADWELRTEQPWSYAVLADPSAVKSDSQKLSDVPFDAAKPPVTLQVSGVLLPSWPMIDNSAGPVPTSPVDAAGPVKELRLVPYGAAKLRVTAFPYLAKEESK